MAQRSLAKRLWYDALQVLCRLAAVPLFHIRSHGRENMPAEGGALVLSNHQSMLDPVLLGLSVDRRMNYVARDTLFGNPLFRWLINSLDAIPIDREGGGRAGLKETLRRLKRDEMVLLFPEGTRTPDGEVQPLKAGFTAIARRAGVPIVPMALDGAYQCWPRGTKAPRPGTVAVVIGPPLSPTEVALLGDRELAAEVERRIRACHADARRMRMRALER